MPPWDDGLRGVEIQASVAGVSVARTKAAWRIRGLQDHPVLRVPGCAPLIRATGVTRREKGRPVGGLLHSGRRWAPRRSGAHAGGDVVAQGGEVLGAGCDAVA